jgi:uracil-DNA glycosylase
MKMVGKKFSHITDENGVKLKDEKGKLLRKYTTQEDADEYLNCALSCNYINFDDFVELYNRKHLED